jgi:type IV secretory pathway VirB4 component
VIEGLIGAAAVGAAALLPVVFAKGDPGPVRSSAGREISRYLPQRRLVRPGVVRNATSFTAVCRIRAEDPALADKEAIKNVTYGLAAAIGLLQRYPGAFAQFYVDRYLIGEYDRGMSLSDNPVHELMDELQQAAFSRRELFGTDCFVALTWQMPKKTRERFRSLLTEGVESAMRGESEIIDDFESIFRQFTAALEVSVSTERLANTDGGFSDLLQFLNRFGPAGESHPFRIPSACVPLNEMMGKEYQGGVEVRMGRHEIGCVDIVTPPAAIEPLCLQPLAQLAVPHTLVVRIVGMSIGEAQKHLDDAIIDHQGAAGFNRAKIESPEHIRAIKELTDARGNVGDEYRRLGKTTTSIVVRARTRALVADRQEAIVGALAARGYVAETPRDEAFDTFIATFAGQEKHGMRTFPIDALETATSLPLFAMTRGERYSSSASFPRAMPIPCTAYAVNRALESYRFHRNASGSDWRHGLIAGKIGSGKSVLVNYLGGMERARLPHVAISLIDRGLSARPMCLMLDGSFWNVLGEFNAPSFSLFADAELPEIQGELVAIFEEWVILQGEEVTALRRDALLAAVRLMGSMPDKSKRTYTAFSSFVAAQHDGDVLQPALDAYGPNGVLGPLFNNTVDNFAVSRFNVIDTTHLRGKGDKFVIPVLRVIFWKIDHGEKKLKQSMPDLNSVIVVDEMQELTRHPLGAAWAALQHKEARKHNRALWLVGPSIKDFVDMADRDALLKASETRLYAPDTGATSELGHEQYEAMQLPPNGREMLARMGRNRWLLHRPGDGTLTELDFALGEDIRGVVGDSRANALIDHYLEAFPPEKYGKDHWKVERLLGDPSVEVQAAGHHLRDLVERRAYAAEGDE